MEEQIPISKQVGFYHRQLGNPGESMNASELTLQKVCPSIHFLLVRNCPGVITPVESI